VVLVNAHDLTSKHQEGDGVAVADVDHEHPVRGRRALHAWVEESPQQGGRARVGHHAHPDGAAQALQPGHLFGRIGVEQARNVPAVLVHEALPVGEARDAVALAGVEAVVLHAGQDKVGLGQARVLQEAAPEAGVEIRQEHLRGRKGRDGGDPMPCPRTWSRSSPRARAASGWAKTFSPAS
jgi:hypothetical protein